MRPDLERQGRTVHCLNLVPNNGDAGLDGLARQIVHYVESGFKGEEGIDMVGFSMGGLVARYYIQRLGGIERVKRFITISSPHNGTWDAFLRQNEGARQMRPGSPFLRDLNRDVEVLDRIDFTSIWTPFDLMILPAHSSVLPVGRAIRVNVAAHPLMMRNSRVLKLVRDALSARE
jgi:triacylglycerol lipase